MKPEKKYFVLNDAFPGDLAMNQGETPSGDVVWIEELRTLTAHRKYTEECAKGLLRFSSMSDTK